MPERCPRCNSDKIIHVRLGVSPNLGSGSAWQPNRYLDGRDELDAENTARSLYCCQFLVHP
jgi:hypothetical protein